MGFLKVFGKTIEYKDSKEATKIIRDHAIEFISNLDIQNLNDNNNYDNININSNGNIKNDNEIIESERFIRNIKNQISSKNTDNNQSNYNNKNIKSEEVKFGFEFEIFKVAFDDKNKTCKVDLSGELDIINQDKNEDFIYQNEYAKYMIEGNYLINNFEFKFIFF